MKCSLLSVAVLGMSLTVLGAKWSDESAELRLDSGVWSEDRSDAAAVDSRLFTWVETSVCPMDSTHVGFLLFLK